jgi:hypothetical protein
MIYLFLPTLIIVGMFGVAYGCARCFPIKEEDKIENIIPHSQ